MQTQQLTLLKALSVRKPSFVDGAKLTEALAGVDGPQTCEDAQAVRDTILRRQHAEVERLKAAGILH